jgi:hypothetical protein
MLEVVDDWKPTSPDQESKRAYFFLHMLGAKCVAMVEAILKDAQEIGDIPMPDVLRCVKLLVCTSSYLSIIEQSDRKPSKWLRQWLSQVMWQLDEMIPDPPAHEITERFEQMDADEVVNVTTERACLILTLRRSEFQATLFDLLDEEQDYRNELLIMALSQSLNNLSEHESLFGD